MAEQATQDRTLEVRLTISEELAMDIDDATLTLILGREAVTAVKRQLPTTKAEVA